MDIVERQNGIGYDELKKLIIEKEIKKLLNSAIIKIFL